MSKEKIKEVLGMHAKWLRGEEGGERAELRNAKLNQADLRHVKLSRAKLFDADLRNADLRHAILRQADLRHAKLFDADLSHADLRHADLFGSDLRHAKLFDADLSHADLRHADLSQADLSQADLSQADLSHADLPETDAVVSTPWGWCHVQKNHIRIGCKYHTTEDWRDFTDEEIDEMDDGALAWWKQWKPVVMAMAGACAPYEGESDD